MHSSQSSGQVTQLLSALRSGKEGASDQLLPLVYEELKLLARGAFSNQRNGHTLQPTALVHEAWVKLVGNLETIEDRRHFFVIAGKAMRQVLQDHARAHATQKRGESPARVTLDEGWGKQAGSNAVDLISLSDVLDKLGRLNARHAQIVELRVFSGFTISETAEVLDVSPRTVDSDWSMARAWLSKELAG